MNKIVIKYDGLANGKGVFICQTDEEIDDAIRKCFSGELKAHPDLPDPEYPCLIEEFLF